MNDGSFPNKSKNEATLQTKQGISYISSAFRAYGEFEFDSDKIREQSVF